ncbi:Appr-1-p processing protein [Microbacterium sp. Root53]|uniref:macro domain-containing protein n=1 Tax=Microbacterium sp. Root53 TaxID=1736553 RepID=UPI0006FB97D5|nr:macro domain-containing protein [Microbacterium sp. Root53]KQY96816.1 Appr-1-p processing protein [Microbacterium sp. Root53]
MVTVVAVRGDITQQQVDAIVNAASPHMRGGGGVDGAIHRAGGRSILDDCIARFPNGMRAGDAGWTRAGDLRASWVIHTVGPNHTAGETDRALLESCYRRALAVADELGASTVAFPLISAGVYGWPLDDAIDAAVRTIARTPTRVATIRLVAPSEETHRRIEAQVLSQFPPSTAQDSVGRLFDRSPSPWGFRGDPYLWRALRAHFADTRLPANSGELEELIREAAETIIGAPLTTSAEGIYVPEFDPGHGMSAGGVSPAWWNSTGIRILIDRFEATLPLRPDDAGLLEPAQG